MFRRSVGILDLFILSFVTLTTAQSQPQTPEQIAAQYKLSLTNVLPFPSSGLTADNAITFIQNDWSLARGRLDGSPNANNPTPVAFVTDPFPTSTNEPVLQVNYPAGSYSHNTGGAQFYSVFPSANTTLHLKSMLLSYEVAFDKDFDWVKGGKLPGVRGGSNNSGCSGGEQATGTDCFSLRLMWRTAGQGEVYGYIPTSTSLCSSPNVLCNPDFGTSIGRGLFSFQSGAWNRLSFLVRLNDPPSASNGNIDLYFNDALAISKGNLQIRASDAVTLGGMFFSTFFGGDDSSWATPNQEHTYYRNIRMWGSELATNTPSPSSADSITRGISPLALLFTITIMLFQMVV